MLIRLEMLRRWGAYHFLVWCGSVIVPPRLHIVIPGFSRANLVAAVGAALIDVAKFVSLLAGGHICDHRIRPCFYSLQPVIAILARL